jgi:molybdopterin molybdotransferase
MISTPADAVMAIRDAFRPVATESVPLADSVGRVLAHEIRSDRPSPACEVSAMDGYAVRMADLARAEVPVAGVSTPGHPPMALPVGSAIRIFTGAAVPFGAEVVVRREDVREGPDSVAFTDLGDRATPGNFIRRAGENAPAGALVSAAGSLITPATAGAAAAVGVTHLTVHERIRLTVITTGDELVSGRDPQPWEIRDSNGPALQAMFAHHPCVGTFRMLHARDDLPELTRKLADAVVESDLVLLTGGVSMGDFDHVPAAAAAAGATTLFHKLPIRPGRPLFVARSPRGTAILGLPGNPLSVLVTARRFAAEALYRRAGIVTPAPSYRVEIANPDTQTLHLWWYRLAKDVGNGRVELLSPKSSGDALAAAAATGFVEVAPGKVATEILRYFPWAI